MDLESHTSPTHTLEIRPLANDEEREAYFQLNAQVFCPYEELEPMTTTRRLFFKEDPAFQPCQLRGAFLDNLLVGGYAQIKRFLCIEETPLSTGCISGVCTRPDFRQRGIAAELLRDALEFASEEKHSLLLLHGLRNFYHRFGFIDVCEDLPEHMIERSLIANLPLSPYAIRPIVRTDAPAVLKLYQEQQGGSPVTFVHSRMLALQEQVLFNPIDPSKTPSVIALGPSRTIEGYLLFSTRENRLFAYEAAARTWSAAQALLQYHHSLLEQAQEPGTTLSWPIALNTPLYYLLADHLPLKSCAYSEPDAGWMARLIDLPRLLEICHPLLQSRWQASNIPRAGAFALHIGEENWKVELAASGSVSIAPGADISSALPEAKLGPGAFMQLIAGFRSAPYLATLPGNKIEEELLPTFLALFPARQAWFAISDLF